jgi:hypothetical protein
MKEAPNLNARNIRLAVDDEGKLTIAFGSKSRTKEHWGPRLYKKNERENFIVYILFGCNATKYKEIQRDTRTEESFFKLRFFCLNFQQFIHASQRNTKVFVGLFCVVFSTIYLKCIPKVHRLYCRASLIEHIFNSNGLWWDNRIKIGKKSLYSNSGVD